MGCKNCCGAQTIFPNSPRCIISIHHEMWGCFGWFTKPPSTMQWHVGLLYYHKCSRTLEEHHLIRYPKSTSNWKSSPRNLWGSASIASDESTRTFPTAWWKETDESPKENWIQYHRDAIVTSLNYQYVYTPIATKVIYESIYMSMYYMHKLPHTHIYIYINV